MQQYLLSYLILIGLILCSCTPSETPKEPVSQLKTVTLDDTVKIIAGKTVYVPVYSHIYIWQRNQTMDLTATLSIRNTDLNNSIIITSVNYYDGNGKLVRKYLEQAVELSPLAAIDFVINQEDTTGGVGASFIVDWVTQKPVSEPVIEAVMINVGGNQGVSLLSPGRVIKSRAGSK